MCLVEVQSVKTTKKRLTWLAKTDDTVDVDLIELDFLLNKDKIEESGTWRPKMATALRCQSP